MKPDIDESAGKLSHLQGQVRKFPGSSTLSQFFSGGFRSGRLRQDNLALVDGEKEHSFQQLDEISTKIGQAILECVLDHQSQSGGERSSNSSSTSVTASGSLNNLNPDGDLVIGVCIQPSDRLISILFGILKAGAAYVPFDISFPEERILKIVNDCRPLLVICDGKSHVIRKFEGVKGHTKVISTDELYRYIRPYSILRRSLPTEGFYTSDNPAEKTAIILYTSGSSGEPKGVRLSHRTVMNRLNWQWVEFPFIPREKCVFKTALTFVDSVAEIFGPLLQGLPLIVFDKTVTSQPSLFMEKLHAYEITRLVLVPSLLKAILQTVSLIGKEKGKNLLSSVRLWVCSGEPLSYDLLQEFFQNLPENFTLCNFYGSTEVMADVTYLTFSSAEDVKMLTVDGKTPIGYPIDNTSVHLLNEDMQLVEHGALGEIFISGSNLAKGYVGIPNSDKFLPVTGISCQEKMYRTGDFGRIAKLQCGKLVLMYEGRVDSQIKVRGHRVDLSEIEATISRFENVSKVKVLCYNPGKLDQTIVAYVVPETNVVTLEQIKENISISLREYERPVVRILENIPLLVNGKTDRQRLLQLFHAELEKREEFDSWTSLNIPEGKIDVAKSLLRIISLVTGTAIHTIAENFDDSFFNIGGTSLNTVVVIVKLREEQYYISIPDFTSSKSIRKILMRISEVEEEFLQENYSDSSMKNATDQKKYLISLLTDKDKEEAIHIISYSFARKGDLEAYVNVSYGEFASLIKSIWDAVVEKKLSFIVRQASNAKAVAVSLSFDVYDEPSEAECSQGIKYVMEFLEHVESQERSQLPKGKGKLLHSFMMGTPEEVDDSERVSLFELMEEENILLGKEKKFVGILTTNTNPLTMQIGRDLHGYEILCEYQVNEYVAPDGAKPFAVAPDSFKVICCWKKL